MRHGNDGLRRSKSGLKKSFCTVARRTRDYNTVIIPFPNIGQAPLFSHEFRTVQRGSYDPIPIAVGGRGRRALAVVFPGLGQYGYRHRAAVTAHRRWTKDNVQTYALCGRERQRIGKPTDGIARSVHGYVGNTDASARYL